MFSLIWHWNDSLLAAMYFKSKMTLAVIMGNISDSLGAMYALHEGDPQLASVLMAACLMYIAPMLIFYMFIQRGFVESIDRVGITG